MLMVLATVFIKFQVADWQSSTPAYLQWVKGVYISIRTDEMNIVNW